MAAGKKNAVKPKGKKPNQPVVMFPSLHGEVLNAISDAAINPEPWFNEAGEDGNALDDYDTNIMGNFRCYNPHCSRPGWPSKKIAVQIRRYQDNGYNAVVFKQRCKSCQRLGVMKIDESSYVERIAYRLKKWAGVEMERPPYRAHILGPDHESALCEGCKAGHCQFGLEGYT